MIKFAAMKVITGVFLVVGIFCSVTAIANVEKVRITWQQNICLESCINGLQKQFSTIAGVSDLTLNQPAAQLEFTWSSNTVPLNYTTIYTAMAMIGLNIEDIHIKATGYVTRSGADFYLTSEPEGTRFQLLGPLAIPPNPSQAAAQYNVAVHPLTPQQQSELLDAMQSSATVFVEGRIFMPERYPPWQLIVQNIKAQ